MKVDQIMNSFFDFGDLYRKQPSVTLPLVGSLIEPGAMVALKSACGLPMVFFRSWVSWMRSIVPSMVCTHSWQKIM